jgi:hypothetical protein
MEFNPQLTDKEKVLIMRNTFLQEKTKENTIDNVGDYLAENFDKIDGFDYRWNSLITSNPLLFEDVDYVRCKQYVSNQITPEEIEAYKNGDLREIYATFENMLVCNLQYYSRIMSFCTMAFLHYVRLNDEEITNQYLDNMPYIFDMTPTQIWCAALSNISSTEWELNYAWQLNNKKYNFIKSDKSPIEDNWNLLYKNPLFARFIEYSALRCGTTGFRQTLYTDKTTNRKLSQVCSKFTRTSTAISQEQLISIYDYVRELESINNRLYAALYDCMMKMFNNDDSQFGIYIYTKEFYLHSSKFSMKVAKTETGKITKDYLANSYECFAAEEYLFQSIKVQIEWAKHRLPIQYDYDKMILKSLLQQMIKESYREIICIKRMNDYGIVSKIKFTGVFNNVFIHEELMFDNRCIRSSKICLSKQNAAQYVIDRGYYLFGLEKDIHLLTDVSKKSLIEHYTNYCVPVLQHMSHVILEHTLSKNDIIDVVCSGILNPNKLNNKNIKYTNIKSDINSRKIMNMMLEKQKHKFEFGKKSYWKVIADS